MSRNSNSTVLWSDDCVGSRQDSVGFGKERRWKDQPKILGSRSVEGQVVARRIPDGKVPWICALQDPIDVTGSGPELIHKIGSPRHQTSGCREYCRLIDRRDALLCRRVDDELPVDVRQSALKIQK